MAWLNQIESDRFVIFVLVLTRMSGLVMTAPIYGTNQTPANIRALLAVALAILVTPSQLNSTADLPATPLDLVISIGGEILIGLSLGLGMLILFSGIQLAGQLISQMSGTALADVFNPTFDSNMPLYSELLYIFSLAIFVTIGGHRMVMSGLLGTFHTIPPGGSGLQTDLAQAMIALTTESFSLGIRASAPAVTALLVATVVMALIGRTVPQLNVLALGFGVNSIVTMVTLSVSLGSIAWIFQDQVEPFIETVLEALHSPNSLAT